MTREEYYFPCSTCHHTECVFTGSEDSHIKCKDYTPQEPVLDKIRAEIESIEHYGTNNCHDFWLRTPDEIKKDVLAIIDKYKTDKEQE